MKIKNLKLKIVLLIVLSLGFLLRVYGLNWDEGHYLHPDERLYINSSNIYFPKNLQEFFSANSPLNQKMFLYGPLPLYIYKIVNIFLLPQANFLITSRLASSVFSLLTIPLIFLISKQLFSTRTSVLSAFIFTFSAGSIQHAHFNTTESILVFLLSCVVLFSFKLLSHEKYSTIITLSLLVGASYATKITALLFIIIPLLSIFLTLLKSRKIKKYILVTSIFIILTIFFCVSLAPYQIIDFTNFQKDQTYMQSVILGKYKPPFTIIYEQSIPYLYQILKVLPFIFGFISFPLSILGGFLLGCKLLKNKKMNYKYLLILVFPILYFLISGIWYAKFARYYILLFPFLSIWAGYSLSRLKNTLVIILLLLITANGLLFMKIYLEENTRIQASKWIYDNVSNQSRIAGEHWDDNLPLLFSNTFGKSFINTQLTVYDQDSVEKIFKLSQSLSENDYFIISSRRVYYSILRNGNKYPLTNIFYKLLFAEKLGYKLEKKFTNYPFYFNDDFADESFQSYDHPPVIIFKNEKKLSSDQIYNLITLNTTQL